MPIRYQQERAAIARMLVGLFRMWADYYSNMQLVDTIEFGFVHLFVFLGDVEDKPMSVSKLSRVTGMSRATVVRRLQELIERNYIERRGRFYHVGDGLAPPTLCCSKTHRYRSPRRRTRNDRISLEPTITAARWEAQAQLDPEGRSAPGQ